MSSGKLARFDVAALCSLVTTRLEALADADNAAPMAAYMKTTMPFYGVTKPRRLPVIREMHRLFVPGDREDYERAVTALWSLPHREDKYMALAFASRHKAFIVPASLPLYERMIREGAWWDLVDEIAVQLVGRALDAFPQESWPTIDRFSRDRDLWIRRTAIICQLRRKERTDVERLFRYCLACAHEKDFFIRKAIGWALRDHSRCDPQAIRAFLNTQGAKLSPLSQREAGRLLP